MKELRSIHKPTLIAGQCSLEDYENTKRTAAELANLSEKYGFNFIFKASFDKANRTKITSERGVGIVAGYEMFARLKHELSINITTDIHEPRQAEFISSVVDVLQIPAFLCRQTDLLVAAGRTGLPVNIKKGQMVQGKDMIHAIHKAGFGDVWLTERGSMFGMDDLVVDFRQVKDMQQHAPVFLDCTHSTTPEYSETLAKCGKALNVDGYFFEVHHNPDLAWSDGSRSIRLKDFEKILQSIC